MSAELRQEDLQVKTPDTVPVEEVVNQVRRDSQQEADRYLEETIVPHGGE